MEVLSDEAVDEAVMIPGEEIVTKKPGRQFKR